MSGEKYIVEFGSNFTTRNYIFLPYFVNGLFSSKSCFGFFFTILCKICVFTLCLVLFSRGDEDLRWLVQWVKTILKLKLN